MKLSPKPSIRLGQNELRLLLRALNAGKPVTGAWYGASRTLAELGLVKIAPMHPRAERSRLREQAWKKMKAAATGRKLQECNAALSALRELARNESGVVLTKRGTAVARTVAILRG